MELFLGHLFQRSYVKDRSVVDEDVDLEGTRIGMDKVFFCRSNDLVTLCLLTNIGARSSYSDTILLLKLLCETAGPLVRCRSSIVDQNVTALGREVADDCRPNT